MNGKGSRPRKVCGKTYRSHYDKIFAKASQSESFDNELRGKIIGGREYLGHDAWHAIDHHELQPGEEE